MNTKVTPKVTEVKLTFICPTTNERVWHVVAWSDVQILQTDSGTDAEVSIRCKSCGEDHDMKIQTSNTV